MALNLGRIFYQLGVETSGLNKANKDVKKFESKSKKSFNAVTSSAKMLSRAIMAIALAETGRRALKTADNFELLRNRINSMVGDAEKSAIVFSELQKISESTGASIQITAGGFQKMLFAKDTVGATTTDMLKLTKSITQLGMLSGTDVAQMNSAMLQFSQGLISGTFQAQEFQSVLESIPAIAPEIAKGMGITVQELIKMKKEGELLSKDVFEALLSRTDEIGKRAEDLPMTLERGFSRFTLGIQQALADIDKSIGLTEKLGEAFFDVGEHVSDLSKKIQNLNFKNITDVLYNIGSFITKPFGFGGNEKKEVDTLKANLKAKEDLEIEHAQNIQNIKNQSNEMHLSSLKKMHEEEIAEFQKKSYALIKIEEWDNNSKKYFQKKYINEKGQIDNEGLKKDGENLRKQLDLASQGSKDAFNISKAVGIAELAVKTPQAIGSAYAWGTATGGPALGVISGALAAAFMGTQIQMIANQQYNGPRAIGGGVYSGGTYLVGENGPELLHMGSDRGFISPNSDLNGLGTSKTGNVNVNVYNVEGQTATVERKQDGNGNMDISVIIKQVENTIADGVQSGTGPLNKSLQSVYGLNRAYGGF